MSTTIILGGRYRLVEPPLGRGGMGTVYEAVQEGLGRRVAVKLLDPRLAEDRQQLERFRREAEIVAALGHPNIVQVTDFQYPETPRDQPFLVMELLRGESLGAYVAREQVLPAQRVAFIASQALSALSAAHRAGVVHRDVKPDNIFLLSDAAVPDTVKVLDFGIAKLAVEGQAKLTGTGAMLGTPAFMAPEQAHGAEDVDARADIYAVGATMYQALSGRLPYEAPSIPALLFAIVEKTPMSLRELRPDLPLGLVEVVEQAMAKDRNDRFSDAEAMRRALAPWSGLPASLRPPVSATAATLADAGIREPTPIVVHRTPPPKTSPETQPPKRSTATLVMITLVIIVAVLTFGTVMIVAIVTKGSRDTERAQRPIDPVAASGVAFGQSLAQQAVSNALSSVAITLPPPVVTVAATPSGNVGAPVVAPLVHQYGGPRGHLGGSDFGGCKGCDWERYRAELSTHAPAISACFGASEHEPPHHETPYYEVRVNESGAITSLTTIADGAPHLDQCLRAVLAAVPLRRTPGGDAGSFKISFSGACTPGMENIPGSCK